MTLDHLAGLLDEIGLTYARQDDHLALVIRTHTYRSPLGVAEGEEGEHVVVLAVRYQPAEQLFVAAAPVAFSVAGPHSGAGFRACTQLMWAVRLVRFRADLRTAVVQATVEVPLDGTALVAAQVERCLGALVDVLEGAYPLVRRAATEGVVEVLGRDLDPATMLADVLAETPPDVIAEALYRADQRQRG